MNTVTALESNLVIEASEPSVLAASRTTNKPRVWTAFATWIVAAIVGQMAVIAGYCAVGIWIGFMTGLQGGDPDTIHARVEEAVQQPLPALLLSLLPFQLGVSVVVLFAARRSKEPFKQRLGLVPQSGRTFAGFSLATMGAFTVSTAIASLIASTLILGDLPEDPIDAAMNDGGLWTITLLSVILSVIPALVEETLFRGYIQRRLLERWSPAVSIGVSTLLFAIVHTDSLQHMIAVVPLGVVTGLLAYRTYSVMPGMLVHAVHNAAAVGLGELQSGLTPLVGDASAGLLMIGAVVVLGLMGLPAIISLLRRAQPQSAFLADVVPPPGMESLATQAV